MLDTYLQQSHRPAEANCPHEQQRQYDAEIARAAVKEVFAILGVDVDDPEKVEEFRKDLRFGGDMRRMRDKGVLTIIGVFFTAVGVAVVGVVFKNTEIVNSFFKNGGH